MDSGVNYLAASKAGLTQFGAWLLRMPMWIFLLLVGAIALAKVTFVWKALYFARSAQLFPQPLDTQSNQVIGIAVYRLTGGSPWLYASIAAASMLAAVLIVWRAGLNPQASAEIKRIRLIFALSWPLVLANLAWFGDGREYLPFFIALAVLVRTPWLAAVGVLGATLSHPEHAFLAFGLLLVLSMAPEFRSWRVRASLATAFALVVLVTASIWQFLGGAESRLSVLLELLNDSVRAFLRHGFLGAYSWWGVWWILVVAAFLAVRGKSRWIVALSALVMPAFVTALALDGTRVFAAVASAVGLAILHLFTATDSHSKFSPKEPRSPQGAPLVMAFVLIALVVLPNVQVKMIGDGIPSPGYFWVGLVENYVIPRLE